MVEKKNILSMFISIAAIAFIFTFIDIDSFISNIALMNIIFIIPVILLIPISILMRAYRFCLIINKDNGLITIKDSFRLVVIALSLNIFMPASLGDIAKAYYGYKKHNIREAMLSSSVIDKLTGIVGVLLLGSIGSIVLGLHAFSIAITFTLIIFYLLTFYPRCMPWGFINKMLKVTVKKSLDMESIIQSYRLSKKLKIKIIALSSIGWVVTYTQFYLVMLAFSVDASFIYVLAISPLLTFAKLIPVTLLGLGSQELVVIYFFGLIGITPTMSTLVSLTSTILYRILPGVAGIFVLLNEKKVESPEKSDTDDS